MNVAQAARNEDEVSAFSDSTPMQTRNTIAP
jgi:hypothetical protein